SAPSYTPSSSGGDSSSSGRASSDSGRTAHPTGGDGSEAHRQPPTSSNRSHHGGGRISGGGGYYYPYYCYYRGFGFWPSLFSWWWDDYSYPSPSGYGRGGGPYSNGRDGAGALDLAVDPGRTEVY